MTNGSTMIVRIVGEPFLSRVKAYRRELEAVQHVWREFAISRGATGFRAGSQGLTFKTGKAPDGWKKVSGRHSWSAPKKGHPDVDAIAALPSPPKSRHVFGDSLIYSLSYEGRDCHGSGAIGLFFDGPSIGWAGDVFMATIPNAKAAADRHLAEHPDHKITSGADKWALPIGLVEISKAQQDLIYAQHRVDQEAKERAA